MTSPMIPLYCECCTTFMAMVPEGSPPAVCPPCYADQEERMPCGGPYHYIEWENDDGTFEVVAL
jgi:hypothetical protein